MSWFNDLSSKVGDLSSKVQAAIPIDKEMIQKLTLTTDELSSERQRIDQEERRKEEVKDSLAGMYPWETRDAEREILVDECKEAILGLSSKDSTFFGPYKMPALPNTSIQREDGEYEEHEKEGEPGPSQESLKNLAKLEPLPPLLAEFDLDAHVGLVQLLLKVDKKLVQKQSTLSGAGNREKCFWRNYFFHCAFTRYEAGLSIDEIWSDQPTAPQSDAKTAADEEIHQQDETITFEASESESGNVSTASSISGIAPLFDSNVSPTHVEDDDVFRATESASSGSNQGADYEIVAAADEDDAELDELEAEIARELED